MFCNFTILVYNLHYMSQYTVLLFCLGICILNTPLCYLIARAGLRRGQAFGHVFLVSFVAGPIAGLLYIFSTPKSGL